VDPTIQDQRAYYDNRWSKFEHANRIELQRLAAVIGYVARIELPKDAAILDLGCGRGWSTNILGMFVRAAGVDLSDTTKAKERFPHCEFITADALTWKGPQAAFDLVVSIEVIEHIDLNSQAEFIRMIRELLKPGGYVILTTPNKPTMNAIAGGGRTWSDQPVENWIDAGQLTGLLRSAGFQVEAQTSVVLGIASKGLYRIVNSASLQRALGSIGAARLWERLALAANFGLHLAILARKGTEASRQS